MERIEVRLGLRRSNADALERWSSHPNSRYSSRSATTGPMRAAARCRYGAPHATPNKTAAAASVTGIEPRLFLQRDSHRCVNASAGRSRLHERRRLGSGLVGKSEALL